MTAHASPMPDDPAPETLAAWGRAMAAKWLAESPPPRPLVRATVTIEPRDGWVGAYLGDGALYVCPLPFLVIKLDRP